MSAIEWPPEIVSDLDVTAEEWEAARKAFAEKVERLAQALGVLPEDVRRDLLALADGRCWKKIPRCFNGWGVGICALPNRHKGDCSPMPDMTKRGA